MIVVLLDIVQFLFEKIYVQQARFYFHFQVEHNQLGPFSTASSCLRDSCQSCLTERWRQNSVSEILHVLNKNKTIGKIQKHINAWLMLLQVIQWVKFLYLYTNHTR